MATATLTETPEEILDWMKKFGFDARSMKQKDKDDTKKLAEAVGRLLNELQSLPDFKELLKRFGEIAETWKWGAGLLQQYKAGGAESDHETRIALRKGMKEALAALKLLKNELDAAQKTPTVDDASDELRRAAGTVTINRSLIEDKVKDGGPGDQLAAKSLERRAADATKLAESLVERGETDEEEGRRGPHRKLAVATLRVVANDQQVFLSSLQNDSSGRRARNAVREELAGFISAIESNIAFARKAPLRDDVLVKINECEADFIAARQDAQKHASAEKMDAIQDDLKTLAELVEQSRGLMSNQAVGLQAADTVPKTQAECDSRFATANNRLKFIETDLARIEKINPSFNKKVFADKVESGRGALIKAKTDAYGRFENVIKNKANDDVLTPMRSDFDAVEESIADIRADVNLALETVDPVQLKGNDLRPRVAEALKAPEMIPGRKDLKEDFEQLLDKKSKLTTSERLFRLKEISDRCIDIIAEHKEGGEEGGADYWTKKDAALKAIEAEQKELAKAKPNIGDRYKLAAAAVAEAELRYQRDDVAGFDEVASFLKIAKDIRTTKLDSPGLKFEKERIRVTPMIESARTINKGFGDRFDTLVGKKTPHTEQDVKDLATLYTEATQAVRTEYKKWEQTLTEASKKGQCLRRLRELKEDPTAPRDQQDHVKRMKQQGGDLLKEYDEAVRLGDRGDYPKGTHDLGEFIKKAAKLEQTLNAAAEKLIDSANKPVDAGGKPLTDSQGKELTWSGPTAKVKDESYGFNTTRDAMRYTAGQEMALDGTLVVSNELDDIAKFLDFKLKKFREICNLGQDPLKIARQVFDPVPENFWPPEAVKVVAVFQAAEQEFDEERLRKEAKNLGLNPEKAAEVDDIRKQIEIAKKKPLPPEALKAINLQMMKDGAKEGLEVGTKGAEELGQLLALANYWTKTDNFGIAEIGKFPTKTETETNPVTGAVTGGDPLMNKPVGYAGDFLELGADVIKVGMSAKDLYFALKKYEEEKAKRDFRARKEDEQISPVKKKMLEYERNRAIATLLNDATDMVLNAISAGGHVPGFNIAGDVKALALAAMEAGRYFAMLATSAALAKGSENDPDSITYLALSRQAEEEGIAGGKKCFEAATKILKLTGDIVQLCGHAAPAGFAINVTAQTLDLGGKACFQLYDWHDASSQNKYIKKAKQKPPDYQAIAEVFSNTRKYARFCIAWGCLHDDAWARSWVMSRGLTDSELDNPETSTAIIRQYINVTQEGLLGETQEEEPETFGESLPGKALNGVANMASKAGGAISDKVNDRNRDIKSQFFDYKVGSNGLTRASWDKNSQTAFDAGGVYKGTDVLALGKRFDKIAEAKTAFVSAGKDPGTDKGDAAYRKASEAYQAAFDGLRSALGAYEPTANPKGKDPHEGMKTYVGDLLMEIAKQSADLSKKRDAYWKSSFLKKANDDPVEAARLESEEQEKGDRERRQKVADFDVLRSKEVDERMKMTDFTTLFGIFQIGGAAGRKLLHAEATRRLELKAATNGDEIGELQKLIDSGAEKLNYRVWMGLSGLKPEIAKDGTITLPKEFDTQFKLQCKVAGAEFSSALEKASAEIVKKPVAAYTFNVDGKYPTPFDAAANAKALFSGGASIWAKALAEASGPTGGWVKDSKGEKIGKALNSFAKVNLKLRTMLKANEKGLTTQSEWRIDMSKLKGSLESLPCATKYGTDHPGMVDLRDRFISQLAQQEQEMGREMARVNQTVDWLPPPSFFDGYLLKASVHKNVVALCKAHLLDMKTDSKQAANLVGACDYARGYWQPVVSTPGNFTKADADKRALDYEAALNSLKKELAAMKPLYSAKHPRCGEPHDGMKAYLTSATVRIGDGSSGLIKSLKEQHASNAAKYKTA